MARTHYNNGDEISLPCGCDGCNPSTVTAGSLSQIVHEAGCPDAWRDFAVECKECGKLFFPSEKGEKFCDVDCMANFYGMPTFEGEDEPEEEESEEEATLPDYDPEEFESLVTLGREIDAEYNEEGTEEGEDDDREAVQFRHIEIGATFDFCRADSAKANGQKPIYGPFVKLTDDTYRHVNFETPHRIVFPTSECYVETPDCSDEAFASYVGCMLWSENDIDEEGNGEPLDANFDENDIDADALAEMRSDLADFLHANKSLLYPGDEGPTALRGLKSAGAWTREEQAAHDFCLTRNGHGTGFWDRPEIWGEENAEKLTEAAKVYGTQGLYVGDDGKLYVHG